MTREPKTIDEQIECLARLTGAPLSFVEQVRELFLTKGVSLAEDADPFLEALEEAFRREAGIRASSERARENLSKIQDNFRKVGQAYVRQISELKKIQASLHEQSRRLRDQSAQRKGQPTRVVIRGDHRTLVTKTVREELPMVPGPKETQ